MMGDVGANGEGSESKSYEVMARTFLKPKFYVTASKLGHMKLYTKTTKNHSFSRQKKFSLNFSSPTHIGIPTVPFTLGYILVPIF